MFKGIIANIVKDYIYLPLRFMTHFLINILLLLRIDKVIGFLVKP